MAHLKHLCYTKVLLPSLLLLLVSLSSSSCLSKPQLQSNTLLSRRSMLEEVQKEQHLNEKKTQSTKNQTKLIKPNNSSPKNQTKLIKPNNSSPKNQTNTIKSKNLNSSKNQTKTIKSKNLNSSKNQTNVTSKSNNASSKTTLNSTTTTKFKKINSTSTKKPLDLIKPTNKTTKSTTDKQTKTQTHETNNKPKKQTPPISTLKEEQDEEEDENDFVSEFKDLPNKFHRTLIPDLEKISTTSKAYITKANYEMTKGFKPYVGTKYASTIATIASSALVLIPLLLVSLLCNKIKTFFSLQKILIFIQIYLSIYFTILCISTLVTGIEPLKFLFSTSRNTYVCLHVFQTFGYVFYLLLLVMYLVLVFSTECGLGSKFLGLAQIFVGFSVGLHYYVTVFHKMVLRQPPKINWKIHGIYATCFLLICLFVGADRRKKAYVENDGEEGKKN